MISLNCLKWVARQCLKGDSSVPIHPQRGCERRCWLIGIAADGPRMNGALHESLAARLKKGALGQWGRCPGLARGPHLGLSQAQCSELVQAQSSSPLRDAAGPKRR